MPIIKMEFRKVIKELAIIVLGKISNVRIQLNNDSIWPNNRDWQESDGNKDDLKKIRELLL